jgi:inosine-uridine nucleoside N-ribohydrolase
MLFAAVVHAEPVHKRVWIDTDPACGSKPKADVDDCLALVQAFAQPDWEIAGVSTVFGNADIEIVTKIARTLLAKLGASAPLRGAVSAEDFSATPARDGLVRALEAGPLEIVALGPLTNIASLLRARPDLAGNIRRIVVVAGKSRPGEMFHPGDNHWVHFRDFNICLGETAAETVIKSPIPLVLMPFNTAKRISVTAADMAQVKASGPLGAWLAERSQGWLGYWRDDIERDGFSPFDSLAVAYAADASDFACHEVPAEVRTNWLFGIYPVGLELVASPIVVSARRVTICTRPPASFKADMLATLKQAARQEVAMSLIRTD